MLLASVRSSFSLSHRLLGMIILLLAGFVSSVFAQTPVTIYNFSAGTGNVGLPTTFGFTVQGRDGNLYSTTGVGGANSAGGVYTYTPAGAESLVYSFPSSYIGCQNGLSLGNDGNLYGTCSAGGANDDGLIYKVTTGGSATLLHTFTGTGGDGSGPSGPPTQASDGNFYGVTQAGGSGGNGAVYKMTPSGVVTTIYSFTDYLLVQRLPSFRGQTRTYTDHPNLAAPTERASSSRSAPLAS